MARVLDAERVRRRPRVPLRAAARLALVAAFVVGFVLVSSVVLVRGRLLDAGTYTGVLVRTDAYERAYTEVLADPELAEVTERLLGGVGLDADRSTQVRTLATSSLRLAVPPSTLRRGTEAFIGAVLAYVRGDTARLDGDVDLAGIASGVRDGAVAWAQGRLATVREQVVPSLERYREAVDAFADDLAAGRIPDAVPVLAGTEVDAEAVVDVILDRVGPGVEPELRAQVRGAVLSGDERGALLDTVGQLVRGRADEAATALRSALEDGREMDVVAEVADRAERSTAEVVGRLDTVRHAARWFGPPTAAAGAVLMAGAAGGIVWLDRRSPRRAGHVLAAAGIASGLAIVALWKAAAAVVEPPLAPATGSGPGTWNLPAGLRAVLADIVSALADELEGSAVRLALVPAAAGAVLAAGLALAPRLRPTVRHPVAVPAAVAVVVALVVWAVPARAGGGEARACNGHPELCGRRYDEVAYAATHNSMSSPDVVRIWPEHDGDIRSQLDAGVRALLIDTHHWTPVVSAEQLTAGEPQLPPRVAEDLLARLGPLAQGRDGAFLCHNECALGAVPLVDALAAIGEFLDQNPDEVVTLMVQDAVGPAETAAAFRAAGIDGHLHEHEAGAPWATLGELIDRGERLIVFAENEGPPPAWYHRAFEHMQDTPYGFARPEDFSCAPNRGDSDAPLLLVNHWVTRPANAPDRATAARVNRHDVIVDRARACERERGRKVNFVAVDFYGLGDVVGAVDTLNGVG